MDDSETGWIRMRVYARLLTGNTHVLTKLLAVYLYRLGWDGFLAGHSWARGHRKPGTRDSEFWFPNAAGCASVSLAAI